MQKIFTKFVELIKKSKSMFLKQNLHMISRDIFEGNLEELIKRNRETSLKGIII